MRTKIRKIEPGCIRSEENERIAGQMEILLHGVGAEQFLREVARLFAAQGDRHFPMNRRQVHRWDLVSGKLAQMAGKVGGKLVFVEQGER